MSDILSGLIVDLVLIGGVVIFGLGFMKKFKEHKSKMLIAGTILILIGLVFLDYDALVKGFEDGYNAGSG